VDAALSLITACSPLGKRQNMQRPISTAGANGKTAAGRVAATPIRLSIESSGSKLTVVFATMSAFHCSAREY